MNTILSYFVLCGLMFGLVTALYIGLKTIKLIRIPIAVPVAINDFFLSLKRVFSLFNSLFIVLNLKTKVTNF